MAVAGPDSRSWTRARLARHPDAQHHPVDRHAHAVQRGGGGLSVFGWNPLMGHYD